MAFKFTLLSDVRSFLKGTADVEKSLDDVADSLDELARDSEQSADEAGDKLARKFSDAFDKVQDDAKSAGKGIGDGLDDGTRKASEGTNALRENAASNAKEVAASFDGSAQSIADGFQGLAAEAFEGFGPAGLAAGAAAAVGLGLIQSSMEAAKEKADDTVEMIHNIASALRDAGGVAGFLADSMSDIVDEKEWFEFWQKLPLDRLALYNDQTKKLGLTSSDVFAAMAGDMDAYDRIATQALRNTTEAELEHTTNFLNSVRQQGEAVNSAKEWNEQYANSAVAAQAKAEEAQKDAADAAQTWADSLNDHLNVAADGLDEFVKDGVLNLDKWAREVKRRTREVATVEDFKVDVFPKLSPEAQDEFAKLPVETQALIAEEYKKHPKKVEAILKAQAKVQVDSTDTRIEPVNIPTTVDTRLAAQQATDAATAAQREADRSGNEIEFRTRIDRDELQRQVNRAAASITPPTITVKTRVQKEVP